MSTESSPYVGTTEQQWLPFLAGLALPELDLSLRPPVTAVVLAPHPDDEILGVGGLMAMLSSMGTRIELIAVTDGEASHPGGSVDPRQLARLRIAEAAAALSALGVRADVRYLHLPDGGAAALEEPVSRAVTAGPDSWLIAPWSSDGHPDHEAVGRAAATAARRGGARLLSYPIWAWDWASPADAWLPWGDAMQVRLPEAVRTAKARAVAAFVTQVSPSGPLPSDEPVLPPYVLARFARPYEVVFG